MLALANPRFVFVHIIVIIAIVPTFSGHLALQLVSTPSHLWAWLGIVPEGVSPNLMGFISAIWFTEVAFDDYFIDTILLSYFS